MRQISVKFIKVLAMLFVIVGAFLTYVFANKDCITGIQSLLLYYFTAGCLFAISNFFEISWKEIVKGIFLWPATK